MKKHPFFLLLLASVLYAGCNGDDSIDGLYRNSATALDALNWGSDSTYVIGHKAPDTDATCSAIAYAELMRQMGYKAAPRVAGKLNNETRFILHRFGAAEPALLTNAAGKNTILVDHSTYAQSADGMPQANILQVIDHHALGDVTTSAPLFYKAMPVGSTCTIVYSSFKDYGKTISPQMAQLMLSALLSDTNNMTSSTVSELDKVAYTELLSRSGIKDVNAFYREMSDSAASYTGFTDAEICESDMKAYPECQMLVGVVNTLNGAYHAALKARMTAVMPLVMASHGATKIYVMLQNHTDGYTDILSFGDGALEAAVQAFGPADADGVIRVNALMSRKKDFIPAIEKVLLPAT